MQRKAIGAFALAATLAGVSASANTLTSFSENFEGYNAGATPTTGWTIPTDAAQVSTEQAAGGTKSLSIDTDASNEVTFTPTANEVTTVAMDVYLTAGSAAPDWPSGAKLVIYLEGTTLKGSVDGSSWTTIATDVAANTWTNITMTFTTNQAVTIKTADSAGVTLSGANVPAKVTSVGFSGTGFVDNFTGTYEYNYAYDDGSTSAEGESSVADATITVDETPHTVTFNYPSVSNMKFVRVYDGNGNYVTLRTTSQNGSIDTSKLSGTVTKVVAYYGSSVSNVDGDTPRTPTAAAVEQEGGTMKVNVGVTAKSGVYYTLVDADNNDAYISGSQHLATPEEEGTTITLKAPVSSQPWGALKFKVKASDEASEPSANN